MLALSRDSTKHLPANAVVTIVTWTAFFSVLFGLPVV